MGYFDCKYVTEASESGVLQSGDAHLWCHLHDPHRDPDEGKEGYGWNRVFDRVQSVTWYLLFYPDQNTQLFLWESDALCHGCLSDHSAPAVVLGLLLQKCIFQKS